MKKIYYLKSCDTCKRILKSIDDLNQFKLIDIKTNPITQDDLNLLYQQTKSYEKLFNKRAQLYKERDLKNKNLTEEDYKNLILEHYTFLARPIIWFNDVLFVGNAAKVVNEMLEKVNR